MFEIQLKCLFYALVLWVSIELFCFKLILLSVDCKVFLNVKDILQLFDDFKEFCGFFKALCFAEAS